MQADDPTPAPRISLIDALDWLADEYRQIEEREQRQAEFYSFAQQGIFEDLEMELRAECAARRIDWRDLLATAAERCLPPSVRN